MNQNVLSPRPLSEADTVLKKKFAESIAGQSELMDKLGQQLISLELAIPGLYATAIKLIRGDKATLTANWVLWLTFGCWLVALILTLISLIPRKWDVDPDVKRQDSKAKTQTLGIEDFFYQSARYKRQLLIPACVFLFVGIYSAIFVIF